MTALAPDPRSPQRRGFDERIASEPPLSAPDLSPDTVPAPVEAHLGPHRRPVAVAGVVEGALGGEGHLVPGAAGVGQRLAREAVQGLVDGLGLGEAGGGVVEVKHGLNWSTGRSHRTAGVRQEG